MESKFVFVLFFAIVLVALISFGINYYYNLPKECTTQECFLERTENCEPTTYIETADILIIENKVNRDCEITRTVIDFTEPVPQEIKDKYLGKESACQFIKGEYEAELLEMDSLVCS